MTSISATEAAITHDAFLGGRVKAWQQARVPKLSIIGVERQPTYAALARRNGLEVVEADLAALPADLRQRQFHHVFFNPPYFKPGARMSSPGESREAARGEETPLAAWAAAAAKRLRPKGMLTVIPRAERLPDLLAALPATMGSVEVLPLQPRQGRAAQLVLLRARKDGRAPFRLCAPRVLHEGADHGQDAPDYTPEVTAILLNAAPLRFGG